MVKLSMLTTLFVYTCSVSAENSKTANITPVQAAYSNQLELMNSQQPDIKRNKILKKQWLSARGKESIINSESTNLSYQSLNELLVDNATGRPWKGKVTTDRVLAILIEFSDFPVNAITADQTQNYYSDYSPEHYENMLFSESGYTSDNGVNYISMNQYFMAQSGGSYQVKGQVAGWYTAQESASHYGAPTIEAKDSNVAALVMEAITHAAKDPKIDLSQFDQEDKYDFDNDGDFREPDGIIDHVMIFHSSVDEATGGGALGDNAIWSHRSDVNFQPIGTSGYTIHNYTIQPIDAAAGVSAHEYGHDLGLPDEYDLNYTEDGLGSIDKAPGSLVGYWSSMSVGSYGGTIPGTAPTGLSPFAKQYLQSSLGGNWLLGTDLHESQLSPTGQILKLDAASVKGNNNDYVRIDLNDKVVQRLKPVDGLGFQTSKISSADLTTFSLDFNVNLTTDTTANLTFMVDYDTDVDGALAQVIVFDEFGNGFVVSGNITDDTGRLAQYIGSGFTGKSNGLTKAKFDLSYFSGQNITVSIRYTAFDTGFTGMLIDNIQVHSASELLADFDADYANNEGLHINGFTRSSGKVAYPHYYLVEWRQHIGVDKSLENTWYGASYTPGMLVWYVDTSYRPENQFSFHNHPDVIQGNNNVANHPGEGWLGLVDADRNPILYNTGEVAASALQIRDASFSLDVQQPFDWKSIISGISVSDPFVNNNPRFIDWDDYSNYLRPSTGRKLPSKGIIIDVLKQSQDKSAVAIKISKVW